MPDEIHAVDRYVGVRLRALRRARRLSQTHLASALGITFQQVQKYENGANRISASKLFEAARTLEVPVSEFFDGLERGAGKTTDVVLPPGPPALEGPALEIGRLCESLTVRQQQFMRDLARTLGRRDGL